MLSLGLTPVKAIPHLFFGQVRSFRDGDDVACLITVVRSKRHPENYYSSYNLNNKSFVHEQYGPLHRIKDGLNVLLVMYELEQLRKASHDLR